MNAAPPSPARPLKIAQFLWSMDLKDGGVVRALLDLCPALAAAGHEVTMLSCRDDDVPAAWRVPGHNPSSICLGAPARFNRLPTAAVERAAEVIRNADVVHVHAMWLPSNDRIAALAASLGKPYTWSPHGMLDDWCMAQKGLKKRLYLALRERSLLERAAFVHCTAEAELQQASKWFPAGRGVVVPLLFDLNPYRDLPGPDLARAKFNLPSPSDPAHRPVVLYLSRIHPKKGVDALIDSVASLRRRGTCGGDCTLIIAGAGDERYTATLKARAESFGLADRVHFVGFVSGPLKTSLYQAADMFVLPSSQENFGYVVVEAMAAGTPVITTKGVALWPQLERDSVAVLCEPRPEPLAAEITRLLRDRSAALDLARRGREWVFREMDSARIIAAFTAMYGKAASSKQ